MCGGEIKRVDLVTSSSKLDVGAETEYDMTCPSLSRIFSKFFFFIYLIFKSLNSGSQIYIQMKSLESVVCA